MRNKKPETLTNLIQKTKQGNEEAYNKLAKYYLKRILNVINSVLVAFGFSKATPEDYLFLYSLALKKTVNKFEDSRGTFISLLEKIFRRMLVEEISNEYKNNYYLFTSTSLDDYIDSDSLKLCDVIADEDANILSEDIDLEASEYYLSKYESNSVSKKQKFIKLQKRIILYKYYGYTLKEIAELLHISSSSVRRILEDDSYDTPLYKLKMFYTEDSHETLMFVEKNNKKED